MIHRVTSLGILRREPAAGGGDGVRVDVGADESAAGADGGDGCCAGSEERVADGVAGLGEVADELANPDTSCSHSWRFFSGLRDSTSV